MTTKQDVNEFEHRTIGPPGCGKTTWLARQVENAYARGRNILIISLTRASAAEVAGRDLPIPERQIGTLHSLCYHALGRPQIAESRTWATDWNEMHPADAISAVTGISESDIDRDSGEATPDSHGDRMFSAYQILRAKMVPRENWPPGTLAFAARWEGWKRDNGLMDFTDLIETCLTEIDEAPGNPDTIFVDEAQDMDRLEMSLVRKWGEAAAYLVVVGDPDQCIYSWRGTDPHVFLNPDIPEENRRLLDQSYRVPIRVLRKAINWIDRAPGRKRIVYHPRDHEGQVEYAHLNYDQGQELVKDAMRHIKAGRSVMFIGSCTYMLDPVVGALRKEGIPFHNPLRARNGAWNPMARRTGQVTTGERVLAFLNLSEVGAWNAEDVRLWGDMVKVRETLQGHTSLRELLDQLENDSTDHRMEPCLSQDRLHEILQTGTLEAGLTADLDWLQTKITSAKAGGSRFPIRVVQQQGVEALREQPKAMPGTIHAVKGGESDVVYLFPDLSKAGAMEWNGNAEQRAAVHRLFYVGMTRARDTLVICQPRYKTMAPDFWQHE